MEKREINHHGGFTPFFAAQNLHRHYFGVLYYMCKSNKDMKMIAFVISEYSGCGYNVK
jgi:hypothetical protein